MLKKILLLIVVFLVASGIGYYFGYDIGYEKAINFLSGDDCEAVEHDLIHPDIEACDTISSPFTLTGEARGYWFFEASFPVTLEDADGNVLVEHYATALGEWMTEDFVPFSTTLTFSTPSTSTGNLILHRDNPSDLPENDDELVIPVTF